MANDVVFKTKAFGGFNKQEVLSYINNILAEKKEAEKKLADLSDKYEQVNTELAEAKAEIENTENLKNEIEVVTAMNTELLSQVEAKESEIKNLLFEVSERDNKIEELENNIQDNIINNDSAEELEFLRSEVQRLKLESEKTRDLERQVGAAMLDARLHSEELVEAARERANEVTKSVYVAIGETAVKIDDLSAGIGEIARSFTKSVEEVELRIKALTGDMSKTAQLLIADSGMISDTSDSDLTEVEYDFSKDITDTDK